MSLVKISEKELIKKHVLWQLRTASSLFLSILAAAVITNLLFFSTVSSTFDHGNYSLESNTPLFLAIVMLIGTASTSVSWASLENYNTAFSVISNRRVIDRSNFIIMLLISVVVLVLIYALPLANATIFYLLGRNYLFVSYDFIPSQIICLFLALLVAQLIGYIASMLFTISKFVGITLFLCIVFIMIQLWVFNLSLNSLWPFIGVEAIVIIALYLAITVVSQKMEVRR